MNEGCKNILIHFLPQKKKVQLDKIQKMSLYSEDACVGVCSRSILGLIH